MRPKKFQLQFLINALFNQYVHYRDLDVLLARNITIEYFYRLLAKTGTPP